MSELNNDEAERKQREAEQVATAASARAQQAEAEATRLRAIVGGIADLPIRANDIMTAIQTARVRVETDTSHVSTVLANLKAAEDKTAAIVKECRGHEAACKASKDSCAASATAAEAEAQEAKTAAIAAKDDSMDIHDLRGTTQEEAEIITAIRVKAEKDAKSEKRKSLLGLILAVIALVGVVALFVLYISQEAPDSVDKAKPVAVEKSQAPVAPAPSTVAPPTTPPTITPPPVVDKDEFTRYCLGNGLTSDECETAWKRYTE